MHTIIGIELFGRGDGVSSPARFLAVLGEVALGSLGLPPRLVLPLLLLADQPYPGVG